jgi:hypothetical protein
MLGKHHGADGRAYRRAWEALCLEFGHPEPKSLTRLEMGRVCVCWTALEAATESLANARQARAEGKGRRPSDRDIERLARRQGLADSSYAAALDKLREMVGPRPPATLAAELKRQGNGEPQAMRVADELKQRQSEPPA